MKNDFSHQNEQRDRGQGIAVSRIPGEVSKNYQVFRITADIQADYTDSGKSGSDPIAGEEKNQCTANHDQEKSAPCHNQPSFPAASALFFWKNSMMRQMITISSIRSPITIRIFGPERGVFAIVAATSFRLMVFAVLAQA